MTPVVVDRSLPQVCEVCQGEGVVRALARTPAEGWLIRPCPHCAGERIPVLIVGRQS